MLKLKDLSEIKTMGRTGSSMLCNERCSGCEHPINILRSMAPSFGKEEITENRIIHRNGRISGYTVINGCSYCERWFRKKTPNFDY